MIVNVHKNQPFKKNKYDSENILFWTAFFTRVRNLCQSELEEWDDDDLAQCFESLGDLINVHAHKTNERTHCGSYHIPIVDHLVAFLELGAEFGHLPACMTALERLWTERKNAKFPEGDFTCQYYLLLISRLKSDPFIGHDCLQAFFGQAAEVLIPQYANDSGTAVQIALENSEDPISILHQMLVQASNKYQHTSLIFTLIG